MRGLFPAALTALLGACGNDAREAQPAPLALETVAPEPACRSDEFEGSRFTVCPYDAERDRLELVDGSKLRSLAALETSLGALAAKVKFAMNAGMYDEDGRPIGLFIDDGRTLKPLNRRNGSGNFHLMPNGVLAVDQAGLVTVTAREAFEKSGTAPRWATQSGPMLVIDGKLHPKFDENGSSQLIRNGVGTRDGRAAYFVISEDPVSFGRFARFFRDKLDCRNALYLDGTVSSLWDPAGQRQDTYSELGPMLVVLEKARR